MLCVLEDIASNSDGNTGSETIRIVRRGEGHANPLASSAATYIHAMSCPRQTCTSMSPNPQPFP